MAVKKSSTPVADFFRNRIERRWYSNSPGFLWIFFPLELLFRFLSFFSRIKFKPYRAKVPVVVVGNINVGGTGKTPIIMALVHSLKNAGYKPGVVSRGYGRESRETILVNSRHSAREVGDEPLEIYYLAEVPVAVAETRALAIEKLLSQSDVDIVLSDDGLQHYAMARDIEISVVSQMRGFGNRHCLPLGPLREPVSRLKKVDHVLVVGHELLDLTPKATQGEDSQKIAAPMNVKPFHCVQIVPSMWINIRSGEVKSIEEFKPESSVAISGIGQPEKFHHSLKDLELTFETRVFEDHHNFVKEDFAGIEDRTCLMTGKDAVKCIDIAPKDCWYLQIKSQLPERFLHEFHLALKQTFKAKQSK